MRLQEFLQEFLQERKCGRYFRNRHHRLDWWCIHPGTAWAFFLLNFSIPCVSYQVVLACKDLHSVFAFLIPFPAGLKQSVKEFDLKQYETVWNSVKQYVTTWIELHSSEYSVCCWWCCCQRAVWICGGDDCRCDHMIGGGRSFLLSIQFARFLNLRSSEFVLSVGVPRFLTSTSCWPLPCAALRATQVNEASTSTMSF